MFALYVVGCAVALCAAFNNMAVILQRMFYLGYDHGNRLRTVVAAALLVMMALLSVLLTWFAAIFWWTLLFSPTMRRKFDQSIGIEPASGD